MYEVTLGTSGIQQLGMISVSVSLLLLLFCLFCFVLFFVCFSN